MIQRSPADFTRPASAGAAFFDVCCAHDLEGVVAKRRDSTYLDANHETAWVKIKNRSYSQAVDRHELFEQRARAGAV